MSPAPSDHLPAVHQCLKAALPGYWPALGDLVDRFLARRPSEALLPLLSCQSAGGHPEQAVPVAAALLAAEVGLIILDDLYDQDRDSALFRQVGVPRAYNFASVLQTLSLRVLAQAPLRPAACQQLLRVLCDGWTEIGAGQDRDLALAVPTLEESWSIAQRKSGAGFATAMEAGALLGTEDPDIVEALRVFGYHTGLAVQVWNDLRGIWFPEGRSDLERGKVTLPVVYALGTEHPDRALLEGIVKDRQVARHQHTIRRILDRIDTRAFLVWAALSHRERALAALAAVPPGEGTALLADYLTGAFGNIDHVLDGEPQQGAGAGSEVPDSDWARQVLLRDAASPGPVPSVATPVYRSSALSLRETLRRGT